MLCVIYCCNCKVSPLDERFIALGANFNLILKYLLNKKEKKKDFDNAFRTTLNRLFDHI